MNIFYDDNIKESLKEVEIEIGRALYTDENELQKIVEHLMQSKGKLIRPTLSIFCASLGKKFDKEIVVKAASAIEILHMASLVHDDIIDEADFRRHLPTIYNKWGETPAILTGDFLYTKAMGLLFESSRDVALEILKIVSQMIEGEMIEYENSFNASLGREQYIDIIVKKTSSLIGGSCLCGSMLSGMDEESIRHLLNYGICIGAAFQIIDDCLDYEGSKENMGKCSGKDLRKGITTLPLIYYLEDCSRAKRVSFESLYNRDSIQEIDLLDVCVSMKDLGVIEHCKKEASAYIDMALCELKCFDECPQKHELFKIAKLILDRKS